VSDRIFAAVFVWVTMSLGWFLHIAQDEGVPFLIRMPVGVAGGAALVCWLLFRLDQAQSAGESHG
jgi:hypothetical protein